jgi:DNA-binding response OmpR family regulator
MQRRRSSGRAGESVRVLIVEDEFLVAMYLEEVLHQRGYSQVYTAHDLDYAHALLEQVAPHFAVLDINIGTKLVYGFAAELSARGIPFIFATAHSPDDIAPEWRDIEVLTKPLDEKRFLDAMRNLGIADPSGPQLDS